jgi:hypothetical protein
MIGSGVSEAEGLQQTSSVPLYGRSRLRAERRNPQRIRRVEVGGVVVGRVVLLRPSDSVEGDGIDATEPSDE